MLVQPDVCVVQEAVPAPCQFGTEAVQRGAEVDAELGRCGEEGAEGVQERICSGGCARVAGMRQDVEGCVMEGGQEVGEDCLAEFRGQVGPQVSGWRRWWCVGG